MRFGLVGTGPWARTAQAPGLREHPEAELVGVWGRDMARTEIVAAEFGARPYADLDALVEDVDAVTFAVPPDVQAELAVRTAAAGRHVLLDKPLALSLTAADRVVDAVQRAGVASVVFFTNRFEPEVESFLHEASHTDGWRGARSAIQVSVLAPGGPLLDSGWRKERGALWDAVPHALSGLVTVLGPVDEVSAMRDDAQSVHLLLRHRSGPISTVTSGLALPEVVSTWEVTFFGEPGTATMPAWTRPASASFTAAVSALATAARTGRSHPCDVVFGREVLSVVDAAERSIADARIVTPLQPGSPG